MAQPNPVDDDEIGLRHVCVGVLGRNPDAYDQDRDVLRHALRHSGVTKFEAHFLLMSKDDIMDLMLPPRRSTNGGILAPMPLEVILRRSLVIVLSLYHHLSKFNKRALVAQELSRQAFDTYRVKFYNPDAHIVRWNAKISKASDDPEVAAWRRSVRPSPKDYAHFKDEAQYVRWRDKTYATLDSHGLRHVIQKGFVPDNPNVYEAQQAWFYKVLQDCMICPGAKSIVMKHTLDKDTRLIWEEFTEMYGNSMTTEIMVQKLSTYLTSFRFDENWKGTSHGKAREFLDRRR